MPVAMCAGSSEVSLNTRYVVTMRKEPIVTNRRNTTNECRWSHAIDGSSRFSDCFTSGVRDACRFERLRLFDKGVWDVRLSRARSS